MGYLHHKGIIHKVPQDDDDDDDHDDLDHDDNGDGHDRLSLTALMHLIS